MIGVIESSWIMIDEQLRYWFKLLYSPSRSSMSTPISFLPFTPSDIEIAQLCVTGLCLVALVYLLVKQIRNRTRGTSIFSKSQLSHVGPVSLAVFSQIFQLPYNIFKYSKEASFGAWYIGVITWPLSLVSLQNAGINSSNLMDWYETFVSKSHWLSFVGISSTLTYHP